MAGVRDAVRKGHLAEFREQFHAKREVCEA
jgi:hypothetical protein